MAKAKKADAKMKCECSPTLGLGALILMAVGFYAVIWGFLTQFMLAPTLSFTVYSWKAMFLYVLGFLLLGVGRHLKYAAHACCSVHHK